MDTTPLRAGVGALALFLATAVPAGAAELSANSTARYGSLTSTLAEDAVSGFALPPDGTTGIQSVSDGNISAAATATTSLSSNSIGAASGWAGTSILTTPTSGPIRTAAGIAQADFDDTLTVTSGVLAPGTPVTVNFSLFAAGLVSANHTIAQGGTGNQAFAQATISGSVTTLGGPGESFFISSGTNRAFIGTDGSILSGASGLLDPVTPSLDFSLNTKVGDQLRFRLRARTDAIGGVAPRSITGPFGPFVNQNGAANAALGLAFGATAAHQDVTLASALYGGSFPLASLATLSAALQGQPPAPIPLPAALPLMLPALVGLARRRRAA
ncbi:MAG: hypothetical protein RLW62_16430, partial [Gammaproteobacteria bacterium]